jgi:hypothetical protein
MNPGGGLDVYNFVYVKTFNKDPIVDNFTPTQGTANKLVVVNGDNYLKPDPTASSTVGLDAFRLIGSRIYLDGKDINRYNYDAFGNILFDSYQSPSVGDLIVEEGQKAIYSPFKENAYVQRASDNRLFRLDNDANNNPLITNDIISYSIRYEDGLVAYDENDNLIGSVDIDENTIDISGVPIFNVFMDNNV